MVTITKPEETAAQPEVEPEEETPAKRKRRTFTLADEAYDTLTASAEVQGTNRSRLVEDLILQEHRTVALSVEAHDLLSNAAEAFGTNPERLAEELVNRCGAILAWQAQAQQPAIPWWQFWRRPGQQPEPAAPVLTLSAAQE